MNNYEYQNFPNINEIDKMNVDFNSINIQQNIEEDQDIKYLEYIEKTINNILLNSFNQKPEYFKKSIFSLNSNLEKIQIIAKYTLVSPIEIYYKLKYDIFHKICHDEEKCIICLENLYDKINKNSLIDEIIQMNENLNYNFSVILLDKCKDHFFHIECVSNMINSNSSFIKCPICNKIYGIQTGEQPNGTMKAYITHQRCSGYENCKTIAIDYSFPSGKTYSGTHRTAYLPDNKEGRKILGLLKVCFDRKLVFTVGTSVTTGMKNTTIWSGIHHKTSLNGGSSHFGYPDPTYFSRVEQEMASKGVSSDSLDSDPTLIANKLLNSYNNNY